MRTTRDFFDRQVLATRHAFLLVLFFSIGALVGALCLAVVAYALWDAVAWNLPTIPFPRRLAIPPPPELRWLLLFFVAAILGSSCWRDLWFPSDGLEILRSLGGREIPSDSTDEQERRLLNLVAEMSVASGLPLPRLALLPGRPMNAITVGADAGNAAIGVTEGLLERLRRDELQAVIAHEFGHILHGDLPVHEKMLTWLHGLSATYRLGAVLAAPTRASGSVIPLGAGALLWPGLLGWPLILIGGCSHLFAVWIRAGLNRVHEFRADAAAVQFTRDSQGLRSALALLSDSALGGLNPPTWREYAHMAFVPPTRMPFLPGCSTHPSGVERIRRLDGFPVAVPPLPRVVGTESLTQVAPAPSLILLAAMGVRADEALVFARAAFDLLPVPLRVAMGDVERLPHTLAALASLPIGPKDLPPDQADALAAADLATRLACAELALPILRSWSVARQQALLADLRSRENDARDPQAARLLPLLLAVRLKRIQPGPSRRGWDEVLSGLFSFLVWLESDPTEIIPQVSAAAQRLAAMGWNLGLTPRIHEVRDLNEVRDLLLAMSRLPVSRRQVAAILDAASGILYANGKVGRDEIAWTHMICAMLQAPCPLWLWQSPLQSRDGRNGRNGSALLSQEPNV